MRPLPSILFRLKVFIEPSRLDSPPPTQLKDISAAITRRLMIMKISLRRDMPATCAPGPLITTKKGVGPTAFSGDADNLYNFPSRHMFIKLGRLQLRVSGL